MILISLGRSDPLSDAGSTPAVKEVSQCPGKAKSDLLRLDLNWL